MHTTLYIDIDEEITSIIDRVRKTDVSEIIIVAPKNALLLQSAVNLRLLKKEADRRKKKLLIITQDKIGKKIIEKAGISVQNRPGNDVYLDKEKTKETYTPLYQEEADEIKAELQKEELEQKIIGTSEYFEQPSSIQPKPANEKMPLFLQTSEKAKEKDERKSNPKVKMSDIVVNRSRPKPKKQKKDVITPTEMENDFHLKPLESNEVNRKAKPIYEAKNDNRLRPGNVSMKKAEKFFSGSRRRKKEMDTAKVSGLSRRYFVIFLLTFIILSGLSVSYFFLPRATISLKLKSEQQPISLNISATSESQKANLGENTVPAYVEQINIDSKEIFSATGTKNSAGKASGKAVIYNEFSSQDQPLVATTRLETEDGKIFRITKNVVVPGITQVGLEAKPGAIEVDVVADQPGENFNIGPAAFKIPGFQSNKSKYEKFYAKSVKAMEGGNSDGVIRIVTTQDIESAKDKISEIAKKTALDQLKKNLQPGKNIFEDLVQVETQDLKISDQAGSEKEKFSIDFKIKAGVPTIQDADVKEIIKRSLSRQGVDENAVYFENPINYLLDSFDNQSKILRFSAKTDVKTGPDFDIENFKKGILGKSAEEAQVYTKNFPEIEKMDIAFWPTFFVIRIPLSEKRVEIKTD